MLIKVEAGLSVPSANDLDLTPLECDLADARRHLPAAGEEALIGFAVRQLRALGNKPFGHQCFPSSQCDNFGEVSQNGAGAAMSRVHLYSRARAFFDYSHRT